MFQFEPKEIALLMHWQIALLNVSLFKADWPAADRAPNVVVLHIARLTAAGGWSQLTKEILRPGKYVTQVVDFLVR